MASQPSTSSQASNMQSEKRSMMISELANLLIRKYGSVEEVKKQFGGDELDQYRAVMERCMIELDKYFDEMMNDGVKGAIGEWYEIMNHHINTQSGSKFWIVYDSRDCEWSRERNLFFNDRPIPLGVVISIWKTKKFDNDQKRILEWGKKTKIFIESCMFCID